MSTDKRTQESRGGEPSDSTLGLDLYRVTSLPGSRSPAVDRISESELFQKVRSFLSRCDFIPRYDDWTSGPTGPSVSFVTTTALLQPLAEGGEICLEGSYFDFKLSNVRHCKDLPFLSY
jgi:hypothetical protein